MPPYTCHLGDNTTIQYYTISDYVRQLSYGQFRRLFKICLSGQKYSYLLTYLLTTEIRKLYNAGLPLTTRVMLLSSTLTRFEA